MIYPILLIFITFQILFKFIIYQTQQILSILFFLLSSIIIFLIISLFLKLFNLFKYIPKNLFFHKIFLK